MTKIHIVNNASASQPASPSTKSSVFRSGGQTSTYTPRPSISTSRPRPSDGTRGGQSGSTKSK